MRLSLSTMPVHIIHGSSPSARRAAAEQVLTNAGITQKTKIWLFTPHQFFHNSELFTFAITFAYTSRHYMEQVLTDVFDQHEETLLIMFDVCGYDMDTMRSVCMRSLLFIAHHLPRVHVCFTIPHLSMIASGIRNDVNIVDSNTM